tara:strand:- start:360 stop:539 length:180 start_codon:yes stop_codon:yes gene_type:complete
MKKLQVNGIDMVVYKTKVKIFDPDSKVTDDHAILLLEYLHFEGFLNPNVPINCEIISND